MSDTVTVNNLGMSDTVTAENLNMSDTVTNNTAVDETLETVTPNTLPKTKRFSYTFFYKMSILRKLDENNGNVYKTAKEAGMLRQTLIGWKKNRDLIEEATTNRDVESRKIGKIYLISCYMS